MLTTQLRKNDFFIIYLPDGRQIKVKKGIGQKLHIDSPSDIVIIFGSASNRGAKSLRSGEVTEITVTELESDVSTKIHNSP